MYLYLARTGGTVQLPDATRVRDGNDTGEIEFLDQTGAVVARFRRADVTIYSSDRLSAGLEESERGGSPLGPGGR